MKIEIKLNPEYSEPILVLHTARMTEELTRLIQSLEEQSDRIIVQDEARSVLLQSAEIFMVRVEDEQTALYTETKRYISSRRLYELEAQLGNPFMRISKSTLVALRQIASVESSFNGMMLLHLKNGLKDYISRTYLPNFKKYLGL